jgi:hypothetical protein
MSADSRLRRIVIAGYVSICLNAILIAVASYPTSLTSSSSVIGRIVYIFGRPAGAFTQWILPGHDLIQILVLLLSTFVFYWAVAWIVFSLVSVAMRSHRGTESPLKPSQS